MKTYYDESVDFYFHIGKEAYNIYSQSDQLAVEPYIENKSTILDIAGANGSYSLALKKKYPEIKFICVDFLENALEAGKKLSKDLDLPITFKPGKANNIPLDDESVEYIILRKALHLLDPLELCVREMHRVLKPGGKVFLIKHIIFPGYPLYYLLKDKNFDFIKKKGSYVHLKHWLSAKKTVKLFKLYGFSDVEIVPTDFMSKNTSNLKSKFLKTILAPYSVKPLIIAYK